MAVEPIPCAPGGEGPPVEVNVTTCCAPSIASAALCRQDGTTVLLVVRSGCVECGETAQDPEVVGWIDPATGVFTPGPAPADAGPCDTGCVDTICVQRCDDTDGDGAADITYNELWCVRIDGSTELVLTYQGDPSVPYGPVNPVDCEYGCVETQTYQLCDDTGAFLRRITIGAGQHVVEDLALDGLTPHTVAGTVRACGESTCEDPTTPAATLGLCLADGTPIAVVVTRDCEGTVTQDGWINLTTGTFSAGAPPVGAMACGNPRAFELAGLLCDVDPTTGEVLGLVLVEYEYNADGSLASVRLVDPATGDTYTLQGELRQCPAGASDVDLIVLCDTAADGTVTSFVRDYRRDAAGQINGHTDYTLDGQPYTPTGSVARCEPTPEPRVDVETGVLCLIDEASGNVVGQVLAEWTYDDQTGARIGQRLVDLATGQTVTVPAGAVLSACPNPDRIARTVCIVQEGEAEFLTNPANAASGVDADWEWSPSVDGPWWPMYDVQPIPAWRTTDSDTANPAHWVSPHPDRTVCPPAGDPSPPVPANWFTRATWNLPADVVTDSIRISASVLNADNFVVQWRLNDGAWQPTPSTPTNFVSPAYTIAPTQVPGARAGENQVVVQVRETQPGVTCPSPNLAGMKMHVTATYQFGLRTWTQVIDADGTVSYLDENGQPQDALPAGYRIVPCPGGSGGGECCEPEPCRNTNTLLLCDQPPTTQTDPVPLDTLPPGPASGSLPNDVDYTVDHGTWFNADQGYIILDGETQTWTFSRPVTVEFAIGGLSGLDECAELPAGVALVTLDPNHTYDPATRLLCPITGNNPARSTFRTTSNVTSLTWKAVGRPTLGRGVVSMDVTAPTPPEQFLRHITMDCDGNTVAVTDTTLDGDPYTVTGEVGQCTAAGGGECCPTEPCRNTNTLLLCDLPTDGTPDPTVTDTAPAAYYPYPSGVATAGAQTLWDGGTLNLPAADAPQPGTTGTVRTAAATIQAPRPTCDAGTAHVTVQMDASQLGPDNGCASTGFLGLYNGVGEANRIALALTPANTPVGWSGTLTVEADVPAADLAAGNIAVAWAFDAYDDSGNVCPGVRRTAWQLSEFDTTVVYDQTGCATQFLRNVTVDCETGAVTAVTDTTLDGQPYTVTGEPGQCAATSGGGPEEPCRNTNTLLLCDLPADGDPAPTVTDTVPTPYEGTGLGATPVAGGAAALWSGGTLTIPATDTGPGPDHVSQHLRSFAATVQADRPGCDTGTATVTASIHVERTGPDDAFGGNGLWDLYVSGTSVAFDRTAQNAPVGYTDTLTLTAEVPAGDLDAGNVVLAGAFETWHTSAHVGGWIIDQFTITTVYDQTGCATQFLRSVTVDCESGAVTTVTDTTLDGDPYTVTGEPGQCEATGGGQSTTDPCQAQNVIQACRCDDTDGDGVSDTDYVELLAVDCTGALTSLGTYTADLSEPYTPVSPIDCEEGAEGAEPAVGVQARRLELAAGQTWSAATYPTLHAVTAVARGGTGTITTTDGASTLHDGESASWSVARDTDALLTGPLTIRADTGTVTVTFTTGMTL